MSFIHRPSIFLPDLEVIPVEHGALLGDAIAHLPRNGRLVVQINGRPVPEERWWDVALEDGQDIAVLSVPMGGGDQGGKQIAQVVALLAISIGAAVAGPLAAGALAGPLGLGSIGTQIAGGVISGGIAIAGGLAVNQLLAPPRPRPNQGIEPVYGLTGIQNQMAPLAPIPIIPGKHKLFPPLAAQSYTEFAGPDQYIRLLLAFQGPCLVEDLKIGDVDIDTFSDLEYEVHDGIGASNITLYPKSADEILVNAKISDSYEERTITDAHELQVDLLFTEGISRSEDGRVKAELVRWQVDYRAVGAGSWTAWVTGGSPNTRENGYIDTLYQRPWGITHRRKVTFGNYDVRVRRISDDGTYSDGSDKAPLFWSKLRKIEREDPLPDDTLVKIAIRAKGTEELNGIINQVSCVPTSIHTAWSGTDWTLSSAATQNPAAVFRGNLRDAGIPVSKIDNDTLGAWYEFCETKGFTCGGVFDNEASLWDRMIAIAAAGRATPANPNGFWTVDYEDTDVLVQHFSESNSWDFALDLTYVDAPHALRVQFLDATADYAISERFVYDDGFNAGNATNIRDLDLRESLVTSPAQAWKFGRFWLAALRLRPESYSFSADVEHILCTRGNRIRINRPEVSIGLGSGRLKGRSGAVVELENPVDLQSGTTYAMRFRYPGATRESSIFTFSAATGTYSSVTLSGTPSNAVAGTHYIWGENNALEVEAVVTDVRPFPEDFSARITAVPYNAAILTADTGTIPDWNPVINPPERQRKPEKPVIRTIRKRRAQEPARPRNRGHMELTVVVDAPTTRRPPAQWYQTDLRQQGDPDWEEEKEIFPANAGRRLRLKPVIGGRVYEVRVKAIAESGAESGWSDVETVDTTVVGATIANYGSIANLQVEGGGATFATRHVDLEWELVTDFSGGTDNDEVDPTFSHFQLKIIDPAGPTTVRTRRLSEPEYTYTFQANRKDNGSPLRTFSVEVAIVDLNGDEGTPAAVTVTNPAPADPTGINSLAAYAALQIWTDPPPEPDVRGSIVKTSTTSGFDPETQGTVRFDGDASYMNVRLPPDTLQYWRVAHYDVFGKTGLNWSSEFSGTPELLTGDQLEAAAITAREMANATVEDYHLAASALALVQAGVEVFASLPSSGNFDGRMVFVTTGVDAGKLHVYRDPPGAWEKVVGDILANTITTGMMNVGIVNGDILAANSLFARHFNAGEVTADALAIINTEQIIPNPVWLQGDTGAVTGVDEIPGWTIAQGGPGDNWSISINDFAVSDPPSQRQLVVARNSGSINDTFIIRPKEDLPIEPGQEYVIGGYAYLNSNGNSEEAWISVNWIRNDGVTIAGPSSVHSDTIKDTWHAVPELIATAPANAVAMRPRWHVRDLATAGWNHRLTLLTAQKRADAILLKDGIISGDKLVTTLQLAQKAIYVGDEQRIRLLGGLDQIRILDGSDATKIALGKFTSPSTAYGLKVFDGAATPVEMTDQTVRLDGAIIDQLTVGTIQVANNAISNIENAFTIGAQDPGTSWTTVQSVDIFTEQGDPTIITASAYFRSALSQDFEVRFRRGSGAGQYTIELVVEVPGHGGSNAGLPFSYTYKDTVTSGGSGTRTYAMQVRKSVGGSAGFVVTRTMTATRLKK